MGDLAGFGRYLSAHVLKSPIVREVGRAASRVVLEAGARRLAEVRAACVHHTAPSFDTPAGHGKVCLQCLRFIPTGGP